MRLVLDTLRNRPLKKKEQAKLSLKNELGTILFCPPSNYSLFSSASVAPGRAKVIAGKAGEAHGLPVPGRNGSRKLKSSQKLPGDPVGAGAGLLVWRPLQMELPSPGPNSPGGVLPADKTVRLASHAVRRIWLPVHGAPTTHEGSTLSHHDGDLHSHCGSQNPSPASCVPGGWETPKPTLWAEQEETWNQHPRKRK